MLHSLISKLDPQIQTAQAHCDVPCKIYDPSTFLIAGLTIVRMIDIMEELQANTEDKTSLAYLNTISRCVAEKEEHAEKVKQEIRVIWGDYIKAPQLEKHPNLHELTHSIMLKASAARQGVSRDAAVELIELLNQFAEIFWDTKGVKTKRATAPYPPALEVVYPDL